MSLDMSNSSATVVDHPEDLFPYTPCVYYSESDDLFLDTFAFYVDGVAKTVVAGLGMVGNLAAIFVLTRYDFPVFI